MEIKFYPDNDSEDLIIEAEDYQRIWEQEKEKIIATYKKITKLEFSEGLINAIVFEKGVPRSNPLGFRAFETEEIKKAVLVHELGHRLLVGNELRLNNFLDMEENKKLEESHKMLYLFLYEVYVELYEDEFANKIVEREKDLRPGYAVAWEWALGMTKIERQKLFAKVRETKKFEG